MNHNKFQRLLNFEKLLLIQKRNVWIDKPFFYFRFYARYRFRLIEVQLDLLERLQRKGEEE